MAEAITAEVTTLTAEVKTLMIGSRQVTLSVFRQLDWVDNDEIDEFGRVNDPNMRSNTRFQPVVVVGRHKKNGTLVKSGIFYDIQRRGYDDSYNCLECWAELPLIVLAGLT